MALNSRDKRASAIGLSFAALLVLPAPGTIDQPDRQQVASCYRGIAAANPIVIDGDQVTTANAYFRRSATGQSATFRRSVTTADSER